MNAELALKVFAGAWCLAVLTLLGWFAWSCWRHSKDKERDL